MPVKEQVPIHPIMRHYWPRELATKQELPLLSADSRRCLRVKDNGEICGETLAQNFAVPVGGGRHIVECGSCGHPGMALRENAASGSSDNALDGAEVRLAATQGIYTQSQVAYLLGVLGHPVEFTMDPSEAVRLEAPAAPGPVTPQGEVEALRDELRQLKRALGQA